MANKKSYIIENFNMFSTVDSYKQHASELTENDLSMVPVPFQDLELRIKTLEDKVAQLTQATLSQGGNV